MNHVRIYPAVDLMDGSVVRLYRGKPDNRVDYEHLGSPSEIAEMWEDQGAEMLHIIDLDQALGRGDNLDELKKIIRRIDIPVQFGGGLRDLQSISNALNSGVERVIIGTLAVNESGIIQKLDDIYDLERIIFALDYKQNEVVSEGWVAKTRLSPRDLLSRFRQEGAKRFLLTSVTQDGTLRGPDPYLTEICGTNLSDIIIAGGVSCTEDIRNLARIGVEGIVIGKALYEKRILLPEAIQEARWWI